VLICPPRCRLGAISLEERAAVLAKSSVGAKYDTAVNRESAYELLSRRAGAAPPTGSTAPPGEPASRGSPTSPDPSAPARPGGGLSDILWGTKRRQGMVETMAKQAARTMGSGIGRQILRGVLGGILGGMRRR
jgi:DNA double-strand break repair helicase HerA and related ATPase